MLIEMGSTASRTHQKATARFSSADRGYEPSSERARLIEALSELHDLLQEYSPAWYTEEHHRKAEAALHPRKRH